MAPLTARWRKIATDSSLERSSHNVACLNGKAYIFGGELRPREPRDNHVYHVSLSADAVDTVGISAGTDDAPTPRVGAATTSLAGKMYLFSGRGGTAMAPIEEHGTVWVFDPAASKWERVAPSDPQAPYPAGRSYHAMAADGDATLYVHAGCPEKGRLQDLWAFDVQSRRWRELAAAPGPSRGGASVAFCAGRLYRMNGFDGTVELGGKVDVYDVQNSTWETIEFTADGKSGPGPRSVCMLLTVMVDSKWYLVTMFGESDPSNLGHQGAGKMLGDAWVLDLEGRKWTEVKTEIEGGGEGPAPRGWFAADLSERWNGVVVAGGLAEDNSRLGDVWVMDLFR